MVFLGLLLLAIPILLPIVTFVVMSGLRNRTRRLEETLELQQSSIDELSKLLHELRNEVGGPIEPRETPPQRPIAPVVPPPSAAPEAVPVRPAPIVTPPPAQEPRPPLAPSPPPVAHETTGPVVKPPQPPERPRTPPPPPPPRAERVNWEQLIGVRMFSAVAGVALVLAAVFFLRYSMDHGWLAPPVRLAIGILTGSGLLVLCDIKAARRYRVTANALDAAAIAILFSTFFAAYALWHLIPAAAAFALLGLVTAVAVLLSIRRDSIFIAVLGLLGGFATPVLLSTGENRPVPLFAYLLLLNIGLAWVAHRKQWRPLTTLTLVFTTIYQWGWVMRFLSASQLSLAMGIFLVFAVMGFVGVMFADRERAWPDRGLIAAVMPLLFAAYLAAVPAYGARPDLLFGFLLIVDAGLLAVTIARAEELAHALGAVAAVLVVAIWLAASYTSSAWTTAIAFAVAFVVFFLLAPVAAARFRRPLSGVAGRAVYAAPALLFVFAVVARIEPAAEAPLRLFAPLFALLALIGWRALATAEYPLYFIAAFFGLAAEAAWSATYLSDDHLRAAFVLYAAFGAYAFGVPLIARRLHRVIEPKWGSGAVLIASLPLLLFLAAGQQSAASLWGLAVLLAILNAGIFIESAAGGLPGLSLAGGALSWIVLAVWWGRAAAAVGVLPALLFLVSLTLTMLVGHVWTHRQMVGGDRSTSVFGFGFREGTHLGLLGHVFLFFTALEPKWSTPPWPLFGALAVLTLAVSTSSLAVHAGELHAAGAIAAAIVVFAWSLASSIAWAPTMVFAGEVTVAYALGWLVVLGRRGHASPATIAALVTLFVTELTLVDASLAHTAVPVAVLIAAHALNIAIVLALAWDRKWRWIAPGAVVPAAIAFAAWQAAHNERAAWGSSLAFALVLYAVFTAYPLILGRRARGSRDPYLAAIAGSVFFFYAGRAALLQGGFSQVTGAIPIVEAAVMTLLLRELLRIEPAASRDLGRLALVAGVALGFATVAIPLQLRHQWITIGWALEGAALAWTYRRIPHRGLLYWSAALAGAVFVRLALNPAVFLYEPRGYRVFNWYLYTYTICAGAMILAAWLLAQTDDRLAAPLPRASALLPAAGAILLFLLLNIEIADFYATGREITFRFGVTLAQDLTYTIGWLVFGMLLLTVGIYLHNRAGRVAAVALIAVTACKAFLYDMGSLGGLYRVGSLVGLAVSLSLVALALQRFVLHGSKDHP